MAVTNVFSTLIFLVAAIIAIFLGFIQKFGAGTLGNGIAKELVIDLLTFLLKI